MKINVKVSFKQVRSGYEYKGVCTVTETPYEFNIKFPLGIEQLLNLKKDEVPSDPKDLRKLVPLIIIKGGRQVAMSDQIYGFFTQLLFRLAVEFSGNNETRKAPKEIEGLRMALNSFDAPTEVAIMTTHSFEVSRENLKPFREFGFAV